MNLVSNLVSKSGFPILSLDGMKSRDIVFPPFYCASVTDHRLLACWLLSWLNFVRIYSQVSSYRLGPVIVSFSAFYTLLSKNEDESNFLFCSRVFYKLALVDVFLPELSLNVRSYVLHFG